MGSKLLFKVIKKMKLIAAIALATTANATTAKHTLCYDNGSQAGQCLTEEIVYTAYNWDSTSKDLTSAGSDHLGEFTFDGSVQGDKTVITKTWTSGLRRQWSRRHCKPSRFP